MSDPINSVAEGKITRTFKVRMSFSRRDLSLLPLYRAMAGMQSEGERREYLRGILYMSVVANAPTNLKPTDWVGHRSETLSTPALDSARISALHAHQANGPAVAAPPPVKVLKSVRAEKNNSLNKLGLSLDD